MQLFKKKSPCALDVTKGTDSSRRFVTTQHSGHYVNTLFSSPSKYVEGLKSIRYYTILYYTN